MKQILLFGLSAFLFACSDSVIAPPVPEEILPPKTQEYTVSLGMTGEITMTTSPLLSKVASTDLYGIQVYSKPAGSSEPYSPCAYGLFDDKTKMTIKLLEGYQYEFKATMVVDGVNVIHHYATNGTMMYSSPFYLSADDGTQSALDNAFKWHRSNYMYYITSGQTSIAGFPLFGNTFDRPFADRYYGETSNYAPSENATVSIDMKRVVFGVKFVAEGLTEGKLVINIDQAPALTLENGSSEVECLVTFKNPNSNRKLWATDGYSESIGVSVAWEKADGATIPLVNKTLTFERRKLHTITIKVKDNSVSNGLSLTQETGVLAPGSNTILNSGDGIETPVNPNP